MNIYREQIMDHYKNPRNVGEINNPDIKAKDNNPLCGDEIEISVNIENDKIKEMKFIANGCAISKSSASILSENIKNKSKNDVCLMNQEDMKKLLGIPLTASRIKCATLSLNCLKGALEC